MNNNNKKTTVINIKAHGERGKETLVKHYK